MSFCRFFDVATVNMILSANKMMMTSLGEYFCSAVLNGCVLRGSSLHSDLGHSDFGAQTFHKVVQPRVSGVVAKR